MARRLRLLFLSHVNFTWLASLLLNLNVFTLEVFHVFVASAFLFLVIRLVLLFAALLILGWKRFVVIVFEFELFVLLGGVVCLND
mmetsp:Transcript_3564/g.5385  ORF Transcript_3564/g.5385 Transcript_3564/m.5385 type:complete len:85 (+) Transcript_3564:1429-1683(+)